MKAAMLHAHGEAPRVEMVADPVPKSGEVLVKVKAAAIHPVVRAIASGKHYASPKQLPVGVGLDGVGELLDGTRVYFGPVHAPHGSMAQHVVLPKERCIPIPTRVDTSLVAALINPGMAAWMPLAWRARLQPGESVLILGATGMAGKLAVKSAKLQGASRIVGAGRNLEQLTHLKELGATSTIALTDDPALLADAFAREAGEGGFDVIIDYLWGRPTETLLSVIAKAKFPKEMRLVEVGESAGPTVSLGGGLFRSTGLSISGFGLRSTGMAPRDVLLPAFETFLGHAARGALDIARREVPLDDLPAAWGKSAGDTRLVIKP